jgi:hypothetical protein
VGIERCGKIHTSNSSAESGTHIGVVAGLWAVVLIRQGPHIRHVDGSESITFLLNRVGPLPKKKPTEYLRGGQLYFERTASVAIPRGMSGVASPAVQGRMASRSLRRTAP